MTGKAVVTFPGAAHETSHYFQDVNDPSQFLFFFLLCVQCTDDYVRIQDFLFESAARLI